MLKNLKPIQLKSSSKTLLVVYVLILLWLVLFKFSFDISSVLAEHQMRSLNIVPFAGHLREMFDNFVVFVPFGLLLSVNFKEVTFAKKLAAIFIFSAAVEMIQYILAIGVTDITDIITNTLGGLSGLIGYAFLKKYVDSKKLDRFIVVVGALLIIVFLIFRLFVLKVRY